MTGAGSQQASAEDPRRVRSRARLIDAATTLLESGGVQAVTIDAVTRTSNVARSTLYRHFDNSAELLAAAFERLLPRVDAPPATGGSLRERVTELVIRQAQVIEAAPIQLAALAWHAMGSAQPAPKALRSGQTGSLGPLHEHVVRTYRAPFDELLSSAEARAELGDLDLDMAISQLVGPVVFARLSGMTRFGPPRCRCVVGDFFAARQAAAGQRTSSRRV